MRNFRDRPIGQKVTIITMVITTSALLLAGLGIVVADSVLYRSALQRDLSALARIIADNSTAALEFNDPDSAAQMLAALRVRTHLDAACIYRPDGVLFARLRGTRRLQMSGGRDAGTGPIQCQPADFDAAHLAARPPHRNPDAVLRSR